jgi:hypothetical protein
MDESSRFELPDATEHQEIVAAARTGLGDQLRSVIGFTPGSSSVTAAAVDSGSPTADRSTDHPGCDYPVAISPDLSTH